MSLGLHARDVTRISSQTTIGGSLTSSGDVVISGKFSGELRVSGELFVEEGAEIKAAITGDIVHVAGHVEGQVKAEKRLGIAATGRIRGDIQTPVLAVASGAVVDGQISMVKKEEAHYYSTVLAAAQSYVRPQGDYGQKQNQIAYAEYTRHPLT